MAERKFFRTTFRGFSKEDVLTHIDTLRAQQQEELQDMQKQIEQAKEERAAARAEADAVIALPAEQLAELTELRQAVVAYEKETEKLKHDLEESNRALAALWEQQNHLQAYIARADEVIADTRALSAQLAARFAAYGEPAEAAPVVEEGTPVAEEVEETASAETEDVTDSQPVVRNNMADWLY